MCTYICTIFSCQHSVWGRRVDPCRVAKNFKEGKAAEPCRIRERHGPVPRRMRGKCERCKELDSLVEKIRVVIGEVKEGLRQRGWVEVESDSECDSEIDFGTGSDEAERGDGDSEVMEDSEGMEDEWEKGGEAMGGMERHADEVEAN